MVDGLTKGEPDLEISALQDSTTSMNSEALIKDVWLSNFFSAMDHISKLVDQYNYISMVSAKTIYPNFMKLFLTINLEGHGVPWYSVCASKHGRRV